MTERKKTEQPKLSLEDIREDFDDSIDNDTYKKLYKQIETLFGNMKITRRTAARKTKEKQIYEKYKKAKEIASNDSESTVFQSARINPDTDYSIMDQKEWVNRDGIKDELYNYLKFEPKKLKAVMKDQQTRAKSLINEFLNTKQYTLLRSIDGDVTKTTQTMIPGRIILMDGHGRMIWQLLNEWYNVQKRKDRLNIVLVEYDEDLFEFHKRNLPLGIDHYQGDIFDTEYGLNRETDVVYYNFMSIKSIPNQDRTLFKHLAEHAAKGIRTYWSFSRQFTIPKSPPAALFSHAFWHMNGVQWYYGMFDGDIVGYNVEEVSVRNTFYTYKINFNVHVAQSDLTSVNINEFWYRYNLEYDISDYTVDDPDIITVWTNILKKMFSVDLYSMNINENSITFGKKEYKVTFDLDTLLPRESDQLISKYKTKKKFITRQLMYIITFAEETYEKFVKDDDSELEGYVYTHAMIIRAIDYLKQKLRLKLFFIKSKQDRLFDYLEQQNQNDDPFEIPRDLEDQLNGNISMSDAIANLVEEMESEADLDKIIKEMEDARKAKAIKLGMRKIKLRF